MNAPALPAGRRPARVAACVALAATLSMLDLALTLRRMLGPGMIELNPIAVWLARETGPAGIIAFKLALTLSACLVLLALRQRRAAEIGSLLAAVAMTALAAHWVRFEAAASAVPAEVWNMLAETEPGFVRL